jgi:Flp pilus assembly protein TadD
VYGYALASIGNVDEAVRKYQKGVELAGTSPGSRHVLLVELALCHRETGNNAAAIAMAQQAAELLPEHYVGWMLLGNLYAESSLEGRMDLAREYTSRAERLKTEARALEVVASSLPQDIFMPYTRLKSDPDVWHQQ